MKKPSCLLSAVAVVSLLLTAPVQGAVRGEAAVAAIGCDGQAATDDAGYTAFATAMREAGIPGAQLLHGKGNQATLYCVGTTRNDADGKAVDAQTVFQAASLSKVVGAYVALRLVDAGVIDLDTPLWQYWASPRLKDNVAAQAITARRGLPHTSGLPNWQISPADPAIDTTPLDSLFAPGQAFAYSGEGFYLLQRTLEHLTGKAWEQLAREQAFAPQGMVSSHYLATLRFNAHKAYGHHEDGTLKRERVFSWENTAWTLSTTARDYHAFLLRALFKAFFALDRDSGQHMVLLTNSQNDPGAYRALLGRYFGTGHYPALDWIDAQP